MLHLRILAFLAVLLASGSFLPAQAQTAIHVYTARVESGDPDASPKPLFAAIVDEYSTADVQHDRETSILTIETSFELERNWISSICSDAGYRLTGLRVDGVELFWLAISVDEAAGMAPAPSNAISNTTDNEH